MVLNRDLLLGAYNAPMPVATLQVLSNGLEGRSNKLIVKVEYR